MDGCSCWALVGSMGSLPVGDGRGCSCRALVGSMGSLPIGNGRVFMQGAGWQYGQLTSR